MGVGFWWESQNERDNWEDIHAGGRVILKWILERERMGWYGVDICSSG
jgi:hypothetical protein